MIPGVFREHVAPMNGAPPEAQGALEGRIAKVGSIDLGIKGVTKATGLQVLCARLGIDASEVLAIGDSMNDIEMLRWAGVGVLMGHAGPEMRQHADVITDPRPGHGVAAALNAIRG